MADQKLTQRNAITETADDSLIHVVAGGASYKTTKANFLSNVPGYSPNNVSAVWTGTGNIFDVTADSYQVDGNTYSSTPGQVTLDVSDPILDRIDLIVAIAPVSPDTIGTVGKITGTPATLDLVVPPDYDPALVFPIKQVTIKADSGVPFKTTKEIVFNEGTEWVFTPLAPVFTLVTDDPYTGTKSIYADGASIPDKLKFTSATVFDSSNVDLLEFYIKSDNVSFDYINLVCQFQLAGSLVGRVGTWITDPQPNDWNRVQINKQQLALLGGTYDELVFYCSSPSGGANFWIDNIAIFEGSGADNANLNISQFINDVPYLRDGSNTSELNNDGSDGVNFFISKLDLNNTITVYNISSDFPGTSLAQLVSIINDTNGFIVTENEIVIHELTLNESTVKEKFIFKLGKGNFGNDGVPVVESNFESLKGATNTSQFINDGENGINPYLDVLESPYNTVIKGVASLLPTKYNLKNLFVTGTTAWTDADADKYIKNYYVDIPNDTITFYITRQYHLTIFAFNNASSLNTITHYLDWGGYVTEPGSQSFRGNTNIQEVVFPKATGDSTFVFENNSALTKLHLPYLDLAWVQNAPLLTDIDFSKAKSLINIKNIGAVGEMYAPLAKVVGFNQANGITSWYLPNVETLSGNMYNNSPITSLYAPNCKTYSATLRNANLITSLHLPNVTNASGLVARAFESDALTEIYMPKAKSFGREAVVEGMFDGSTIGAGCTLTVNEFLRTSNGGAMNINLVQAISRGIKVVFAKDVNIALDNRILNASVTTTYDFDHSKASDWKLTMIADTTFTESNLPTLDKTIEYTFKLTGAFTPTFPAYWDVLGDTYDGALWNFIAVQVHNGNSGSEEVTVFITNIQ